MTEPSSDGTLVRYYCTAGNGMEPFLMEEVKRKLAAEEVFQMPGKVLFSSSAEINRVTELKAAERLFLLLKVDSPVQLSAHISPAKAASVLQSRVLGDRSQWTGAVMTWSRLQGALAGRRTAVNSPRAVLGVTKRREESRGREDPELNRGTCGAEAQTVERKRTRDDEEKQRTPERERKRRYEEEEEEGRRVAVDYSSSCRQNGRKGRSEPDVDETSGLLLGGNMDDNVKPAGGRDESRTKPEPPSPDQISFRISCKCTGSLSRYFSTQEVSQVVGVGLSRLLGWKIDLKNPQLEVNVSLSDDHVLLGFPLTRFPLANRSYIRTTGLRSTVSWAVASLAHIQPGFCVLDPMCGVGTILIEAAQEHQAVWFLGVDIDDGQLQKANENVEFAQLGDRIQLLKASSLTLPLPSSSVDAVVCDLPFGRKFGTKTSMAADLPLILSEMQRVLCMGGTLVLLLSPQLSFLLKKLLPQKDSGPTSHQETKPQTGIRDCPSPPLASTKQQTSGIHQGMRSSPPQEAGCQSGLQHGRPPPLCSLKHQETLRVSLGAIDGLIHRYVKTDT